MCRFLESCYVGRRVDICTSVASHVGNLQFCDINLCIWHLAHYIFDQTVDEKAKVNRKQLLTTYVKAATLMILWSYGAQCSSSPSASRISSTLTTLTPYSLTPLVALGFPPLQKMDDSPPRAGRSTFSWLVGASQLVGLTSVVLTGVWMGHFRGGFAWDGSTQEFNLHPLCMVLGMVFLQGDGESLSLYSSRMNL